MPELLSAPPNTYYAVMRIATGESLYIGTSESLAADKLDPGCCYGKGENEVLARRRCIEQHTFFANRQGRKADADSIT